MSDQRLRERFRALREVEMNEAPSFEHTLSRKAPVAASISPWLWAPATAFTVVLLLLLVLPPAPPQLPPLDPGTWTMPTDVLLEIPGSELLRDLPDIGNGFDGPSSLRTEGNRRILA